MELQALPDVGFLGAVLVAVERGSAWHQALGLLQQAARCHHGQVFADLFGGSRERTEMCFGFSIRLVVAFVLSLYCIISNFSFLIFQMLSPTLDVFTQGFLTTHGRGCNARQRWELDAVAFGTVALALES